MFGYPGPDSKGYAGKGSGHDEHGAGHAKRRVRLAIIGERAGCIHEKHLRCARVGDRNERTARCRCRHAGNDSAADCGVIYKITIKGKGGICLDLDAFRRVGEVAVGERDRRWSHHREVLRGLDIAIIHVGDASARITHAARAFRIVGARGTIALGARTAAIDAGFHTILHHIGARRRGADHGIAISAGAIRVRIAVFSIHAAGTHRAAAIDVGLEAILRRIGARRRRARHHRIAIGARAIGIVSAPLTVHARRTRGTAAIGIRLVAILHHIGTRRRRALHHRIAIRARTVTVRHAGLTVHAIVHARAAAIGIRFHAILESVIACRRGANLRHRIAETARAVAV